MKIVSSINRLVVSAWVVVLLLVVVPVARALVMDFGSGNDVVHLVIESDQFGTTPLVYNYSFTYDPDNRIDSYDLLSAVDAAFTDISFDIANFGTTQDPNYFLNSITYKLVTVTNTGSPDYSPYWNQWVSGGDAGYPTADPVAFGEWDFGSGLSSPYRLLSPMAWEGFIFNDGSAAPSVLPVPEPGSVVLVILASSALLFVRNKKKNATTA